MDLEIWRLLEAGWGRYWRKDGEEEDDKNEEEGEGGKEKDVRYDMCAVQRAMRWMNPTGCWKATC